MKPIENQRTIKNSVQYSGIGLHTGSQSTMVFKPAEVNTGVRFVRMDLDPPVEVKVDVENVVDTVRGTTIGINGVRVHTVEHVLAALAGLGIDNLIIELSAHEPPVGDGSSAPFLKVLREAGIVEQDSPKRYFTITEPVWVSCSNGSQLVILPDNDFRVTCTVDYNHPVLKSQSGVFSFTDGTFEREISTARTFCFSYEVDMLKQQGLIKGGSLENAIVIGEEGILNKEGLRFPDEFVRHKILDLIGDLYLLGQPVKGHLVVEKIGHTSNVALVKKLREYAREHSSPTKQNYGPDDIWIHAPVEAAQIQEILPHRYPFLFVDRILKLDDAHRATGIKNVSMNEYFFEGHFPGHPVMPGVLIVEAMAQVAGIVMLSKFGNRGKLAYLLGVDNAKFRKPVLPGDQLRFEVEITRFKAKTGKVLGVAYVDKNIVAEAELTFALVEK